jgi:hypothetical protein
VQLVWVDSHNGSILFVKIANVEDVLAVQRVHVVVEFVPGISLVTLQDLCEASGRVSPESQSSELWPREACDRAQIKAINHPVEGPENESHRYKV